MHTSKYFSCIFIISFICLICVFAIEEFNYSPSQKVSKIEEVVLSADAININTADKSELMTLDGIGEALAERIISYRAENKKFESVYDLCKVSGIGKKIVENNISMLTTK